MIFRLACVRNVISVMYKSLSIELSQIALSRDSTSVFETEE